MYYVSKRMEIAGAHQLKLPYESKCENLHGHNWIVTVYCKAEKLTEYGMIVDFKEVKNEIHGVLDHGYINDIVAPLNPTAENMAKWICDKVTDICEVGYCYKVSVQESEGNIAIYERGEDEE
jgi:6-pyruvoyltetrahydropterin/6-carboxytetrahydropterin synthase